MGQGRPDARSPRRRPRRAASSPASPPRASARNVRAPAIPSAPRPRERWYLRRARAVAASKRPSTFRPASPKRRSLNSSTDTSQPTRPRESARCPRSGFPRRPSSQRVRWPTFPVARIPLLRCSWSTAPRVSGPETPSTGSAVEPFRAQPDLERRDLGARSGDGGSRKAPAPSPSRGRSGCRTAPESPVFVVRPADPPAPRTIRRRTGVRSPGR